MEEQKDKSLKQLKEELVSLGMPQSEVDTFNSKGQLVAVLNILKATAVVKRVDSLEDKETPQEKKLFETQYASKAERMKELLLSQRMVRTLVPLSGDERPGVVEWRTNKNGKKYQVAVSGATDFVQLNGYKWIYPKGVYFDAPEQVAEVINNSHLMTMRAGENISLDRIDPRTGKPMNESI